MTLLQILTYIRATNDDFVAINIIISSVYLSLENALPCNFIVPINNYYECPALTRVFIMCGIVVCIKFSCEN